MKMWHNEGEAYALASMLACMRTTVITSGYESFTVHEIVKFIEDTIKLEGLTEYVIEMEDAVDELERSGN